MYPPPHMTHMYPTPHMTHMYPPPHMTHVMVMKGGRRAFFASYSPCYSTEEEEEEEEEEELKLQSFSSEVSLLLYE